MIYTNDVHTYIDKTLSYATVSAMKQDYQKAGKQVLLVDAGDHIQGTAYGGMDEGKTIVQLMNAAGYDLGTLGNHEFDYGMARALATVQEAKFPYVSCNFYHEKNGVVGDPVLDSYKVFDMNGTKVAFVGITTPESFTKSTPAYFQDANGKYIYGIAAGKDGSALYAAVQKAIDAAAKEADYVIALGHLGDDPSSQPWTSEEVIAHTTGLDAFIDGHSHSTVEMKQVKDKAGNTVVLTIAAGIFPLVIDAVIQEEVLGAGGGVGTLAPLAACSSSRRESRQVMGLRITGRPPPGRCGEGGPRPRTPPPRDGSWDSRRRRSCRRPGAPAPWRR